jgi:hypothetical protein
MTQQAQEEEKREERGYGLPDLEGGPFIERIAGSPFRPQGCAASGSGTILKR